MDIALIPPEKTAHLLGVSLDTLQQWNEINILKPSLSGTGQIGYRHEQIHQFIRIRKLSTRKTKSFIPFTAFVLSFLFSSFFTQLVLLKLFPQNQNPLLPVLATQASRPIAALSDQEINSQPLPDIDTANLSYSQTSNSVFDTVGNIRDDAGKTNVLASSVFFNPVIPDSQPVHTAVNPTFFISILVICFFMLLYIYRIQPRPLLSSGQKISSNYKVIELKQKTDGSLVLSFQDQEIKISKPELDSESDQFIERLMEYAASDTKEVDYDSSSDLKINLNAPLSKLVTRLGFVGIKRDLFFPRTSKNRVLFRRFITEADLASMNITKGQLIRELLASN